MRYACLFPVLLALAACAGRDNAPGNVNLSLADTALADGAPRLALQVSQAVLATHPGDVQALLRQGDAQYALGELEEASQSYKQALKIRPGSMDAMLGLGRVTLVTDPAGALAWFDKLLALLPENQAARTDRGVALDLLGRHAAAQAEYRRVIAEGTSADGAKVDLGLSLAMSGDAESGVRILRPIASAPDASARVREDLAVALTLAGHMREAGEILLTQMSAEQARKAIAAYRALRDQPLPSSLVNSAS